MRSGKRYVHGRYEWRKTEVTTQDKTGWRQNVKSSKYDVKHNVMAKYHNASEEESFFILEMQKAGCLQ